MNGYIYGLAHPKSKDIFYVGATFNISNRHKQHLYSIKTKDPANKMFAILNRCGITPEIVILEEVCVVSRKILLKHESIWIKKLSKSSLYNVCNNPSFVRIGRGIYVPMEKFIKKSSKK